MPANNKRIVTVRGDGSNWYWIYTVGPRGHAVSVQTFDRKGNAVNAAEKVAEAFDAELLVVGGDAGMVSKLPVSAKADSAPAPKKAAGSSTAKKAVKKPQRAKKAASSKSS